MHWLAYCSIILLSTFLGWLVIGMAIKFLFHPRKGISIAGFRIQGIFPKNQDIIAMHIGKIASNDFFHLPALEKQLISPDNFDKLKPELEIHIDDFLRNRLKDTFPMLSMFIGDKTITQLKSAFLQELETLFPAIMKSYANKIGDELDIEHVVYEKVRNSQSWKLEQIILNAIGKELMYLKLFFAVLGFLFGLIQVFIMINWIT